MNLAMIKEKIREDHDNKLFLKKVQMGKDPKV